MSKSKKRSIDEIQELKRLIKDQAQTIKSLERQLKKLNEPDKAKKVPEPVISVIRPGSCPKCQKGNLKTIDLGPRRMSACDKCEHRIITKNG